MPYQSKAQQGFFHTANAKKAGITEDEVNEFDKASKGKKLPERKMADGGEVKDTDPKTTEQPNEIFHNAINGDWEALKSSLSKGAEAVHQKFVKDEGDNGNLKGLQDLANKKAKGYADGGDVDPVSMMTQAAPMAAAPTDVENGATFPPVPDAMIPPMSPQGPGTGIAPRDITPSPISQAATAAQSIPPTNPGIYQGMTAQDRATLMQQLLAQKASPGMLAAKGVAGLGDAITGAFGKAPTNAMGNIQTAQDKNIEQKVGVMDTERQQKMQDLQAGILQQENDPNSSYSQAMRSMIVSLTGKQPGSQASAAMLKGIFPDIAKIMDSQLTNATARYKTSEEAQAKGADQGMWHALGQKIMGHLGGSPGDQFEAALGKTAGIKPTPGANSSGWSVVR